MSNFQLSNGIQDTDNVENNQKDMIAMEDLSIENKIQDEQNINGAHDSIHSLGSPVETPIPHVNDSPSPFPNDIPSPFPATSPTLFRVDSPERDQGNNAHNSTEQSPLQSPLQSPIPGTNRILIQNDTSIEVITPSPKSKKTSKSNLSIKIQPPNQDVIENSTDQHSYITPKSQARIGSSSIHFVQGTSTEDDSNTEYADAPSPNVLSHSLDSGGFFSRVPPLHIARSPKTATTRRKFADFPSWEGFAADIDEYQKQNYRASTTAMDLFNVNDRKNLLKRRASIANISSLTSMPDIPAEAFDDWCDFKLVVAKRETDQDVRIFAFELRQSRLASIGQILGLCSEILNTTVDELKKGKYEAILSRLRELNTNSDIESKKYVRKLMFIFSKCSRLLLYIRKQRDSFYQEHTEENKDFPRRQRKKGRSNTVFHPSSTESLDNLSEFSPRKHIRIVSEDGINREDTIISPEKENNQPATPLKAEVIPPSITPIKLKDQPQSPGKQLWSRFISTFKSFKRKSKENPKRFPSPGKYDDTSSQSSDSQPKGKSHPPKKKEVEILCRICEELINASELPEHSKTCSMRHDIENRLYNSDERLRRLAKSIQKRIQMSATSNARHLSDIEVRVLQTLEELSNSVSNLKYTPHSISRCEALLNEAINIREESPRIAMEEGHDSRKAKTIQVYSQRIAEVIQQKLDDMQKRLELPGVKDQPELQVSKHKTTIKDFDIIKPISRGAFGTVYLARKKRSNDLFAIKVLKKEQLIRRKQTKRVLAERNIMAIASSEFIVNFYYSFQGKKNLFIVMEYCRGGDVFSLLQKHLQENQAFSIETARQFISETILALKYLHSHNIVHRDLKPDNILICADGHIKLTDFGLSELGLIDLDPLYAESVMGSPLLSPYADRSKKFRESTDKESERFRGTPDYLAPEILLGEEHSTPVDWWAVGILLFEFLYGCPPFNSDTPSEIFDNILSLNIPWPPREIDDTPIEAIDLIEKLLVIDPKKRLGTNGAEEVMNHPFFKDVDWVNLRCIRPHFVPKLNDEEDIGCFSPRQRIFPVSSSMLEDEGISPPMVSESYSPVHHSGSFEDTTSPFSSSIDFSYVKTNALAELALRDREYKMMAKNEIDSRDFEAGSLGSDQLDNSHEVLGIAGDAEFDEL